MVLSNASVGVITNRMNLSVLCRRHNQPCELCSCWCYHQQWEFYLFYAITGININSVRAIVGDNTNNGQDIEYCFVFFAFKEY